MLSELESLKQHITELEAKNDKLEVENAELKKGNTKICDLRIKLSISDAEIAELKRMYTKVLRANGEYNEMCDTENAKLKAIIKELKSENIEFRDRLMKVEQNQSQNDSNGNNTPDNNSSNFNSAVGHHGKLSQEKEMDNFLLEADKKIVSDGMRQCNREKKLKKAEQASLNQDRKSGTSDPKGIILELSNSVTKILARGPCQNSHRKKGAENIV